MSPSRYLESIPFENFAVTQLVSAFLKWPPNINGQRRMVAECNPIVKRPHGNGSKIFDKGPGQERIVDVIRFLPVFLKMERWSGFFALRFVAIGVVGAF